MRVLGQQQIIRETMSDESEEDYVSRAMASNLDYPIIVINYPDGPWIADGTHRAWKARELGIPYLQGWILDWEEILDVPHGAPMPESFKQSILSLNRKLPKMIYN